MPQGIARICNDAMSRKARFHVGVIVKPGTKLAEIFAAKKRLVAGDAFFVDYTPGIGTVVSINGKAATDPITEPVFFTSLMKIWLGASPADWQLKDALRGQSKS